MCNGGGGGGNTNVPYDNSAEIAAQKAKDAADARDAAAATTERAASNWRQSRDRLRDYAVNRASTALTDRGLSSEANNGYVLDQITQKYNSLDESQNPATAFSDDWVNDLVNSRSTAARTTAKTGTRASFAGRDPNASFTDTMDDPYIDSILNAQRTEAQATLDRAKARGQLNDVGYADAIGRLDTQASAGRTTANSLTDAVLSGYRKQLTDINNEATARAGSLEDGEVFDPSTFTARYDAKQTDLSKNFGGAVNAALTGQKFFDIGDIINGAGNTQGVANPTPALLDAQAERDRLRNTNRGVGNEGGF